MQSETLSELIRAAYLAGAEDVHNAWMNGYGQSEADFGEAAGDYAASVEPDPKPSADSAGLVERLRAVDISWSETGELCAEAAHHIAAQDAEIARLRGLVEEARVELRHVSVFVRSREKMHPAGVALYDDLLTKLGAST